MISHTVIIHENESGLSVSYQRAEASGGKWVHSGALYVHIDQAEPMRCVHDVIEVAARHLIESIPVPYEIVPGRHAMTMDSLF